MSVISLLTDFGFRDGFVGTMKGVILNIAPEARIVDISHAIAPQRVDEGAFVLRNAYSYFPEGTVHVAVVDPGVGGARRAIIVDTPRHRFVGPDNGIFAHVFANEPAARVWSVTENRFLLPHISATFHGRDVFAPVAAHLALGKLPCEFGGEITNFQRGTVSKPTILDDQIKGHVWHIDHFGNIISDIEAALFLEMSQNRKCQILVSSLALEQVSASYDAVSQGSPLAILDSAGLLEIAVNEGNAAEVLGISLGDSVAVTFSDVIQ